MKKDNLRRDLQEQVIQNILKREHDRLYPSEKELAISKRLINELGVDLNAESDQSPTIFGQVNKFATFHNSIQSSV